MNISDVIESAIWLTGEESQEMRDRYEQDVRDAIGYFCYENYFFHGPVTFHVKHPMDDKAPEVPDHISGPKVRLLIAESTIVGKMIQTPAGSFVANLDYEDLKKLRAIIRKHRPLINDEECDGIIEELGPEAALDTLH